MCISCSHFFPPPSRGSVHPLFRVAAILSGPDVGGQQRGGGLTSKPTGRLASMPPAREAVARERLLLTPLWLWTSGLKLDIDLGRLVDDLDISWISASSAVSSRSPLMWTRTLSASTIWTSSELVSRVHGLGLADLLMLEMCSSYRLSTLEGPASES